MLAACTPESFNTPQGIPSDHSAIVLTPVVARIDTKAAATEAGDDNYNENLISGYYWFVYSDDAGANLVSSGYAAGNASTEVVLDAAFPTGGSGSVYVVANLPVKPETPVAGDEWFEYVAPAEGVTAGIKHMVQGASGATSDVSYSGTFASLKTLSFGKSTPTTYTKSSEFYEYTSATTGVPKPEKFVMRTEAPVPFTLQEQTVVPVKAELKRVAAKVILDLHIAEEVTQTHTNAAGEEVYDKTWLADVSHLQIYMLWGSTRGNLAGSKAVYSNEHSDWFYSASPRYAMYTNPAGGSYDASTDSVTGSVPSSLYESVKLNVKSSVWEVVYQVKEDQNGDPIWIWGPDVAEEDKTEENEGDKAFGDWDYVLKDGEKVPVLNADGTVQRRLGTVTEKRPYYAISSLPLYSMPISWNLNDAHAPFIKIILPWQGCIRANNGTGDIVSYDEKPAGTHKTTDYYYKILIPELWALDANGCYHISLDLAVLGSEADEVPVEVTGNYHVVDWNTPIAMGGDQSAGRYLNCATSFEFYSQTEMNIPISSSHDIEIVGTPTATYFNYSQLTVSTGNLDYSTSSSTGNNFKVTAVGNNKVTVIHEFNTDLTTISPRDVSPIQYTFTVQHKGDGGSAYKKTITIIQYPSLYVKQDPSNHYVFVNTYGGGNSIVSALDNSGTTFTYNNVISANNPNTYLNATRLAAFLGNVVHPNANLGSNNANTNNYNIYVSALKELPDNLSDAYIADPREDIGTSLTNINGLTNYRKTRQDASMAIAPAYKIASSYGMCANFSYTSWGQTYSVYGGISYDNAVKRCATYQENGYPAGRWRVPTKAEILFAVSLSNSGCVPPLFEGQYRANDGQYYDSTNNRFTGSATDRSAVRCVYDVWYWGENKYNNSGNEITGTGTAATQWIGFKTE